MMIEPVKPIKINPRDGKNKPISFPCGERINKTTIFEDKETGKRVIVCQPIKPVVIDDTKGKKLDVLI